jgi:ABC-type sulfate/molybdate transport systems ATPase subunit
LWLTKYLVEELTDTTVVTVSHDRAFLNEVCTHIIWMRHGKLYATDKTAVNNAHIVLVAEPINRLAFLLLLFLRWLGFDNCLFLVMAGPFRCRA